MAVGEAWASTLQVGRRTFERVLVRTPWLESGTDLAEVLETYVKPHARPGDLLIVSEKALVHATGRGVPAATVQAGPLAHALASRVQPTKGSRGLSIPEKMQFVIEQVGRLRVVAAALAGAATRPIGIRGAFYVVAGRVARDMDGMRPPYEDLLLPPLSPSEGRIVAQQLLDHVGMPVAIVDINDRGGSVRAVAGSAIGPRLLRRALRDNPLGQRGQSTPVGIVRPLSSAGVPA